MEILITIAMIGMPIIIVAIGAVLERMVLRERTIDNTIWETIPKNKRKIEFDMKKTGVFTATVGYENLKEMGATLNEAEKLIKNAKDWKI